MKKKRRWPGRVRVKKVKVCPEGQRLHVICGTDCERPCTKEIEDEGRDWRQHQNWPHKWHNGLCDDDCKLDGEV